MATASSTPTFGKLLENIGNIDEILEELEQSYVDAESLDI